ncbi:MAG: branched-chain amino acid ABC transporter permease [Desulfohalobiaceae bacterium]|nr:branched-chain amino acid ABC transporter permease [Desulfohalobiaceae bacterium]
MELAGLLTYFVFFLTMAGIYAVLSLGLNVQWGYTGQINIGVAAFFAIGAYTAAILTTPSSPYHLGGFGLPFLFGILGAMITAGILAFFVGLVTLKLRGDYLAIASIGIAEIVRLFLKNEGWLTNGVRGIPAIPKPLSGLTEGADALLFLFVILAFVLVVYLALERLFHSPWVRVLRAVRVNEDAVQAAGKNVLRFRLEAFVLGSVIMGVGGALYAHFTTFISPSAFDPMFGTFLVWVMLIAGGSGNNRGALLGAVIIWGVWSGTEIFTSRLPELWVTRASAIRIFMVGALLEVILIFRPQGLLPEKPPKTPGTKRVRSEE